MSKPFKATYTQWSTFNTCPAQYHAIYISKDAPRSESEALRKGRAVHDNIEQFLLGNTDELHEAIHESWREHLTEVRDKQQFSQLEARLDNDIAYGKLDLFWDNSAAFHIRDWKTGKARVHDPAMREQLRFYVWLLGSDADVSLDWVEHPFGPKSRLVITQRYSRTLDRVWRTRIDKMRSGPYPATPNWKCSWCPYKLCPHNKNPEE